ncbi:hypothetical protein BDAP_002485 [Binucleata daphniae]
MSKIDNWELIDKTVTQVKLRKLNFVVFKINEQKNGYVELVAMARNLPKSNNKVDDDNNDKILVVSKYIDNQTSARHVPSKEILIKRFDEMIEYINPKDCCYIVYDFGFFNSDDAFRSVVCLIIYIPDDHEVTTDKFVYSSNSLFLKDKLQLGKQIVVNCIENLNFDYVEEACANFSKF